MATLGLLLLALLTWTGGTQQAAELIGYGAFQGDAHAYLLDIRGRALEVFLAARTTDGLIALMESVQVGPVVAEARPGMVLEPIREVMDHLGDMMTVSVISVQALDIVRRIGARVAFAAVLPLGLVLIAVAPWLRFGAFQLRAFGQGVLVLGAVLTIGLPSAVCAEKYISKALLDSEYGAAYQDVSHIKADLDAHLLLADPAADLPPAVPAAPVEAPSLLSRMEGWFGRLKDSATTVRTMVTQSGMDSITEWLNAKVESALTLMALFLVEVFVMPTMLGYALYRGFRSMIVAIFTVR